MVLVGDAVHASSPTTGGGFGTSIDDATGLARSLHGAYGSGGPDAP
jgi:2-polyprenyl-6-methoxyphenol hydroxylase-like FAD-dependent oxidoreductase